MCQHLHRHMSGAPTPVAAAQVGPKPPSFGAQRRLVAHKDEPLLFEAELVKVKEAEELPQVGVPAGLIG